MPAKLSAFHSRHFTIHPLAEGVYAAIARTGGSAICNAGIVDLGGLCLIFDTFLTPRAAEDLLQAVELLTGPGPLTVINSHYHNDHIWGNQVFNSKAHVVASNQTRQLMLTEGKKELEDAFTNAARSLASIKEQQEKAEDEQQRHAADLFVGYYQGLVDDLPHLKLRLPDITFVDRMKFYGKTRSAELIAYDRCHTGSDAILLLPDDGLIFMGDLLFVGCHPYLGDGDPENLAHTLKEIQHLDATRFVPGHGAPGDKTDLVSNIEYLESCLQTAQELARAGNPDRETIASLEPPEQFKHWEVSRFYPANLLFLCQRFRGS